MIAAHRLVCGYCDLADDACGCSPEANRRVSYDLTDLTAAGFLAGLSGQGVWRYQALLPVAAEYASPLLIGGTPLLDLGAALDGARLFAKDDSRNPSGSLKDRATEVALAVARAQGHQEVVAASTGNAGASLACVAAAVRMTATVVVPAAAPRGKLAQIAAYGARIVTVDGSYDDAFDWAVDHARRTGVYCRNTGVNPYVREGKKTSAFEIAEQLGWTAPDWMIVPCGDGNILSGIEVGFAQLTELGILPRTPRIVAAQSESSNGISLTLAQAVRDGSVPREPVAVSPRTAADSISVSRPRDHVGAVRALLRSDGLAVTADEDQIKQAWQALSRDFGLWVEPSSAVAYAVARKLRDDGTIRAGQTVVILATGTGLKDPSPWDA